MTGPLFSHIGQAEGLPYPVALALAQDRDGFIWIGTPGGLARWDGYRMRVFRHRSGDPRSLPENIVAKLMVDEEGRLWVGTVSGLVARYVPEQEDFVTYHDKEGSGGRMQGLASDGEGGVWAIGTNGLAHLDAVTGQWRRDDPRRSGMPPGGMNAIGRDRNGTLWLGTAQGLMRRSRASDSMETVAVPGRSTPLVVTALYGDREGTLWFGTAAGEVGFVDPKTGDAKPLDALKPSGQRVNAIVEVTTGTLWFGDFGRGIRELHKATGAVRLIRHDPQEGTSLSDDSVTDMLVDRSGLVWTSGLGGVDLNNPASYGIATILPAALDGLLDKDVRSMAVRPDGKVWLGFRSGGIALLDPAAGRLAEIRPGGDRAAGPPRHMIQAIAAPTNGELWAGSRQGLYRLDPVTGTASPVLPFEGTNVLSLLADGDTLWAGGSKGLVRIDLETGAVRVFAHDQHRADSLSDDSAQVLLRDKSGRLWVGTQRGLNLFDAETGTFERFLNDPDDPESLPNNIANTLLEDRQGRLWVGTANGIGILTRDGAGKPRFRTLDSSQGLPHDTVTMLLQDQDGVVWVVGGDRLATVDPNTMSIRTFGLMEGAGIRTHWVGSGARLSDGTLLFGGFGGMTVVRPGARPEWSFRSPVVATEVRVDGKPLPIPSHETPVTLTPDDRDLAVEFAALDFSDPSRNRYAYRLEDFDRDWVAADAHHRTATYTGLPPGSYRLWIRGTNRSGAWSEPTLALAVDVRPAWYQTSWFHAATLLAGVAVLFGAVQGRTALLRRRERQLERLVALRTAEVEAARTHALAEEAHARRAQQEAEAADQAKSRFLAVVSHEIRTPLNGVMGMLQMLDPAGLAPEQRRCMQIAKESGNNLVSLIESILEYGRYEAESETVRSDIVDPRWLAEGAVELFRPQAVSKGIQLELEAGQALPTMIRCDSVRIVRVLHNLLGNAIKFTPQGRITVSLDVARDSGGIGTMLQVIVADTGIGVAPEMQDAIFQDFVQADDSIARRFGGTGLGLAVCRRIATLLRGSLTLESAVGAGSTFRLAVPFEAVADAPAPVAASSAGTGLSILLVDDDPINRQVGLGLLDRLGYQACVTVDGLAAIDAAVARAFDVVMMDLHMPDLDGIEAIRCIRQRLGKAADQTRFIIMTADVTELARRRCTEAGIATLLAKPLYLDMLRDALASAGRDRATPPPETGSGTAALLDLPFLTRQAELLGLPELTRLARLFSHMSRRTIADLDAAAVAGNQAEVQALAHRLCGAGSALGMTTLCAAASAVETDAATSGAASAAQVAILRRLRWASLEALLGAARTQRPSIGPGADQKDVSALTPSL